MIKQACISLIVLVFAIACAHSEEPSNYYGSSKKHRKKAITAQQKLMNKRARDVVKARDKLIREQGANVQRYGNTTIIKAKGTVKRDLK